MKNLLKKLVVACLVLVATLTLGACTYRAEGSVCQDVTFDINYKDADGQDQTINATITLYKTFAPETCKRILSAVKDGFLNDTALVYNKDCSYIVLGDYEVENSEYKKLDYEGEGLYGEFTRNGFESKLKAEAGSLVMLREPDSNKGYPKYDTAKIKFAILLDDASVFSNADYCVFGKVKADTDTLENLVALRDETETDKDGMHHVKYVGDRNLDTDEIDYSQTFEYAHDNVKGELYEYVDGVKSIEKMQIEEGEEDYELFTKLTEASDFDFVVIPNTTITVKNFKKA
ncbi:MAG: peptidylprolyl isomerase [Clostridia bacterium]|nr:peptidylprolyl isomerase [Clostridia bacterium]